MLVMHYAGVSFVIDPAIRDELEASIKKAANAGEFSWVEFGYPESGGVDRFLIGPAIAVAFTEEPDPADEGGHAAPAGSRSAAAPESGSS